MSRKVDPLTMGLISITEEQSKYMGKVTETTVFSASTRNFHPQGLFSTEIFGLQGSDSRLSTFGLIDLKIDHIHPIVFKLLVRAKVLYENICNSRTYAIFNKKTKDFEESDGKRAETGYSFFIKHVKDLKITLNGSSSREELYNIVNKYRGQLTFRYLPVMPAGIRDYTVDDTDMPKIDAVNDIYRKIVSTAGFVSASVINPESLNAMLYSQQENLAELDEYIDSIILGKTKFHNKRVLRRAIHGSTRNVITSLQYDFDDLDGSDMPKVDDTVIGLFQYLKGVELKSMYDLMHGFLKKVFPSDQGFMYLTNKKSLKMSQVEMSSDLYQEIMTYDGLNKQITKLFAKENRSVPLEYGNYYFGIYYESDDIVWVVQDKDDLPIGHDPKKIQPLTFYLLAFISVYETSKTIPAVVSRYPVLTEGGAYPSFIHLKPTSLTRKMTLRMKDVPDVLIGTYPILDSGYFNSQSVSDVHLQGLGGDFDGDKCSFTPMSSEDSIREANQVLNSVEFYRGVDGKLFYNANDFIAKIALQTFTED